MLTGKVVLMQEVNQLKDALRRFQKSLYTLNTVLREMGTLSQALESLESSYSEIKRITMEYKDLERIVEEFTDESDLLPVIKETKARFDSIHGILKNYRQMMEEIDSKFEKYRKYRYYMFKQDDDVLAFVESIVNESAEYILRPLMLEKVDLTVLEKIGKKVSKFSYSVPGSSMREALEALYSKMPESGFYIEGEELKITWKPESGVLRVNVPKERVFEIDRIAERFGGTALNV